jgi:cell division protein FtsI/penicillin-binding protein 2
MKSPSLETTVLIMGGLFSLLVIGLVIRFIYMSVSSKDDKKMYMKKKDNNTVMGNANRTRILSNLRGLKKK